MARDPGLEDMLAEDLAAERDLTTKPMFGGLAWLCSGHLCLAARSDGLLVRLGPGREGWALDRPGIRPMRFGARPMRGWIWAEPDVCGDDDLRVHLLSAALAFVRSLPAKRAAHTEVPLDLLGVRDVPASRER
jgi:hypothetical protein